MALVTTQLVGIQNNAAVINATYDATTGQIQSVQLVNNLPVPVIAFLLGPTGTIVAQQSFPPGTNLTQTVPKNQQFNLLTSPFSVNLAD